MTARARSLRSIAAEQKFRARIGELGGTVVGVWRRANDPVDCICSAGHRTSPKPSKINSGRGMCRTCVGQDPVAAWENFCTAIGRSGGEVMEPAWLGSGTRHRVRCRNGHECYPMPLNVAKGQGPCRRCAGQDPVLAEQTFRDFIAKAGGRVVGPYVNCDTPVRVICVEGHEESPTPYHAVRGMRWCIECSGRSPALSEAAFRARVAALGGVVVGNYVNAYTRVDCICPVGHPSRPTPAYMQAKKKGMCPVCAGNDPETGKRSFYERVTELGGRVVGPYVNSSTLVECVCRAGHACRPRPSSLTIGQGLCSSCAGKEWDAFYVVVNPSANRVKFGITSGNPRARLGGHRRAGYTDAVRVLRQMSDAHALERSIRSALRDGGIKPVQGREYFDSSALPLVLDIADGWVAATQKAS